MKNAQKLTAAFTTLALLSGCAADKSIQAKAVWLDIRNGDQPHSVVGYVVDEGNGAFTANKHVTFAQPVNPNKIQSAVVVDSGNTDSKLNQVTQGVYNVGSGVGQAAWPVGGIMTGLAALKGKLQPKQTINVEGSTATGGNAFSNADADASATGGKADINGSLNIEGSQTIQGSQKIVGQQEIKGTVNQAPVVQQPRPRHHGHHGYGE